MQVQAYPIAMTSGFSYFMIFHLLLYRFRVDRRARGMLSPTPERNRKCRCAGAHKTLARSGTSLLVGFIRSDRFVVQYVSEPDWDLDAPLYGGASRGIHDNDTFVREVLCWRRHFSG